MEALAAPMRDAPRIEPEAPFDNCTGERELMEAYGGTAIQSGNTLRAPKATVSFIGVSPTLCRGSARQEVFFVGRQLKNRCAMLIGQIAVASRNP